MSKPNINNITFCQLDNTKFETMRQFLYHLKKLNVSEKEYFDKFIKKENDGFCNTCRTPTQFISVGMGYKRFCSNECSSKNEDVKKLKFEKTKESLLKKYGVDCPGKIPNFTEKAKQTKLLRYGDENYVNSDKAKQTCLKKYGFITFSNTDKYKEKYKQTCLRKYGVEYHTQSNDIKNTAINTNLKKYGKKYYTQTNECKERTRKTFNEKYGGFTLESDLLKEKVKLTMLDKYGTDNAIKNENIKKKQQLTNIKKYGGVVPTKSKEVINKTKQTNINKYGIENTFNLPKTKITFWNKYGVLNPSQIPDVKEKAKKTNRETCFRKYGVKNVMQVPYYRKLMAINSKKSYQLRPYITVYNNIVYYQSKPELEFIKYCESKNIKIENGPLINYTINGKQKVYYSDFLINDGINKRIIEIKRKHTWWKNDLKTGIIREKTKSAIKYSKEHGYLPYKILFRNNI